MQQKDIKVWLKLGLVFSFTFNMYFYLHFKHLKKEKKVFLKKGQSSETPMTPCGASVDSVGLVDPLLKTFVHEWS